MGQAVPDILTRSLLFILCDVISYFIQRTLQLAKINLSYDLLEQRLPLAPGTPQTYEFALTFSPLQNQSAQLSESNSRHNRRQKQPHRVHVVHRC